MPGSVGVVCLEMTDAVRQDAVKPFLITAGTVFGLVVVAYFARIAAEPQMAREPWFLALTLAAAALSAWAWRLVWKFR